MTYITAGELHTMRTIAQGALAGTAIILRATTTPDGQGGQTSSWTAAGTVACNLAPVTNTGGDEAVVGDRLQSASRRYLTVPALTDLLVTDRVVSGGGTFEVIGVREPRPVEVVRRAVLSEIQ